MWSGREWIEGRCKAGDNNLHCPEAVLRVAPGEVAQWLEPTPGNRLQDHLYLVDPLGNLMMRFPADMDAAAAAKAKRDLERLLRASNSWDTEGR